MNDLETKTLVPSFGELPVDVQNSVARFLVGCKLGEIVDAHAHGVNEIEVQYFRHGTVHRLIWDNTTHKMLGGTEPVVMQHVLSQLLPAAQQAVKGGGETLRNLKIKHSEQDDREYLHVHYVDSCRRLTSIKLEMDGSAYRKH